MMHAVCAEWKKIWFPKSSRLYLPFAVVFSILTGLLFAFTTETTQHRALSELPPMSVIEVNMLGVDVAAILLVFFTAAQISREFQVKTIQIYLQTTPNRARYFGAKLLSFFLLSLAVGATVSLAALGNGQLILLSAQGRMLPVSEVWRFAAGCVAMPLFYALFTVCASFFSRRTAPGIMLPLAVMLLPAAVTPLPRPLREALIPALPAAAVHTLSGAAQAGMREYTGVLKAFLILAVWSAPAAVMAMWRFRKKDI